MVSTGEFVVVSLGVGIGVGSLVGSLGLDNIIFSRIYLISSLVVASDLGRCLRTKCDDSPGHIIKLLLSIVAHHVNETGDPASPCKYLTISLFMVKS